MDGWYRCPSRPPSLSCGRVQARGAPANIHACTVGLMEARGTNRFAHGSTCTDWKPWKRIECTELFPDGVMESLTAPCSASDRTASSTGACNGLYLVVRAPEVNYN